MNRLCSHSRQSVGESRYVLHFTASLEAAWIPVCHRSPETDRRGQAFCGELGTPYDDPRSGDGGYGDRTRPYSDSSPIRWAAGIRVHTGIAKIRIVFERFAL